jgi:hypothetical protein
MNPNQFGPAGNPQAHKTAGAAWISAAAVPNGVTPPSNMPAFRIATTVGLGGGSASDNNAMWTLSGFSSAVGLSCADEFRSDNKGGVYPLILAPGDGFIVRNSGVAGGAVGIIRLWVSVDWTEMLAY